MVTDRELSAPKWSSARVRLRPIENSDLDFLYRTSTAPETSYRWRYRGAIPEPAEFASSLKNGVLVQFIVEKRVGGEKIGLVTAYNANHRDGFTYVAGLAAPKFIGTGYVLDGIALLMDYLFELWPFRKLYFESIEFNVLEFASVMGSVFREEARLAEHTYHGERYWDVVTLAAYRGAWLDLRKSGVNRLTGWSANEVGFAGLQRLTAEHQMDIEEFCGLLMTNAPPPSGATQMLPDDRLAEDLGYDSLGMLEIAAIIDELAGGIVVDWPDEMQTARDAFLWYTTISSLPSP
jgi:RimJ/RimL family protein N-acetyltransferase